MNSLAGKEKKKEIMMDKAKSDQLWGDLKIIVKAKLEELEESAGIKVGRDETERQEHINRAAGMMYGHLVKEVKGLAEQVTKDVSKRIEKFS